MRGRANDVAGNEGNHRYDLIVIGAGGAGSTVAGEANNRGARVALIERWKVGGTCLNVGCDPTKTLVRSAQILHQARHAARFGITVPEVTPDWPAVIARVDRVIDTIRGGDGDRNIRESGVSLFKGTGRFVSPHEVEVNGETLWGEKIVIATGASEVIPPIEGLREAGYITNVEAVALPELPRSMTIIGGGVIGCEFAQVFARFGVEVTILGAAGRLLPREDEAVVLPLQDVLRREGVAIQTSCRVDRVVRRDGLLCVSGIREGERVEHCATETILVAAGRKPSFAGLDLEAAGVVATDQGIVVDAEMMTNVPHIAAVGDATGLFPFTHIADYQARIAENNLMGSGPRQRADYRAVPWTIFTDPELARVGLTEAQARDEGYDVKCATVQVKDLARAITAGETEGVVKLVSDRATGQVLGGHILSANAGEMLSEIVLAMRTGLPVSALCDTIHSYPTLSEGVFWAAFELAKPDMAAIGAARGHQAAYGEVPEDV
ncbi:MAG: Dihydrolipoamide dehydrogenase [uncultured Thermomicrobiales bacterium]|uniref:Dihydrolipoyl dehydrogenase n=1 Tax=uncultured Thermomicrobiales bacterium TaxID=1645740 RepID=A0A6J4USC0_9BACT|nr:MAG: Dihydrolipoamide dehydrogenase [uncultured Thermomicrobiales bacterium]